MSDVTGVRRTSPLAVVVSAATALVVLVCAIAAGAMLLGGPDAQGAAGAESIDGGGAPAASAVSRDDAAGRPAPDDAALGGETSGSSAVERATAAVVGALGSSTCTDARADAVALLDAVAALGDATTWIRQGVLDVAVGKPLEELAVRCGSVHASSVLAAAALPDDVASPLAAYVTNGGARSSVDATTARDALAAGVPSDLLVGTTATRSVRRFMLPSGNIACALGADGARCEIAEGTDGTDPTGTCAGSWGGLVSVASGVGVPGCLEGWSALGDGTVLRYGESTRADGFSCAASTEGVACRNDATGHGFWLRSSGHQVF